MVLADTSVWIDHLRRSDAELISLLQNNLVACHPHIVGELALGSLGDRTRVISLLENLPEAPVATHEEVLEMVDLQRLYGRGVGYTDAHLLASARLQPGLELWTRDKRLHDVAIEIGVAHDRP